MLLDKKYHYPVCFLVMQQRYFELRKVMRFDELSVDLVNAFLDQLQIYDASVHDQAFREPRD